MRHWIARPTESTIQLTLAGDLPVVLQKRSDLSEQVAYLGLDGGLKRVADIPGTCTSRVWYLEVDDSSGRYYLMAEEANRPPSVLRIENGSHDWFFCLAPEVQVSKLGRSELIDFEVADMQCRGVMLLPPETRPPYPMIVSVYGGVPRCGDEQSLWSPRAACYRATTSVQRRLRGVVPGGAAGREGPDGRSGGAGTRRCRSGGRTRSGRWRTRRVNGDELWRL